MKFCWGGVLWQEDGRLRRVSRRGLMRWRLICNTTTAVERSVMLRAFWIMSVAPRQFSVMTLYGNSTGDLSLGRSFDIKEPGSNPLKTTPHNIAECMRFYSLVST